MGKYGIWGKQIVIAWGVLLTLQAQARVQDFTQDYSAAQDSHAIELPTEVPETSADPWPPFFAHLSGFNQARNWGLSLQGRYPEGRSETLPMAPASVQKMVTAASALIHLGSEAKFENYFDAQFDPSSHELFQPKFSVSGDPTWGQEQYEAPGARLNQVIMEMKKRGVSKVHGPITVTAIHPELDQVPMSTLWPKTWTLQCMATQSTSFMFNGNCGMIALNSFTVARWLTPGVDLPITLRLTKARRNELVITPVPDAYGRIKSYEISGKFASPTHVFFDPLQNAYVDAVPVHEGTRWLENLFILTLAANQIAYENNDELAKAEPPALSDSFYVDLSSTPLLHILQIAVQNSINGIMDRTFLETGFHENLSQPEAASYSILRTVSGNDNLIEGVEIHDGSGLVPDDRLRVDLLWAFLQNLQKQSIFPDFLSTLAVAGKSGTLASRLTGPLTNGKIFGKTGTLDGVYNLAGYFQTQSKSLEPFVIFSESHQGAGEVRGMIDKIATEFARLNTGHEVDAVDAQSLRR